jgi:hypothetical protein
VLLDGGQCLIGVVNSLVVDDRAVAALAVRRSRLRVVVEVLNTVRFLFADRKSDCDVRNRIRSSLVGWIIGEGAQLCRAGIVAHAELEVSRDDDLDDPNAIVVGLVVRVISERWCG